MDQHQVATRMCRHLSYCSGHGLCYTKGANKPEICVCTRGFKGIKCDQLEPIREETDAELAAEGSNDTGLEEIIDHKGTEELQTNTTTKQSIDVWYNEVVQSTDVTYASLRTAPAVNRKLATKKIDNGAVGIYERTERPRGWRFSHGMPGKALTPMKKIFKTAGVYKGTSEPAVSTTVYLPTTVPSNLTTVASIENGNSNNSVTGLQIGLVAAAAILTVGCLVTIVLAVIGRLCSGEDKKEKPKEEEDGVAGGDPFKDLEKIWE